jgi:hypothetical protein
MSQRDPADKMARLAAGYKFGTGVFKLYPYQQKVLDALAEGKKGFIVKIPSRKIDPAAVNFSAPQIIGIDLATGKDKTSISIDRRINALDASRKKDRELLASVFSQIGEVRGAKIERQDTSASAGYCGQGIDLSFSLNGVGAMLGIDNLHGGEWVLISWHNTEYPARNFTSRFCGCVGDRLGATGVSRPHHKATTSPGDWYSLAMFLDAGLMLAARSEAFEPSAA